MFLKSWLTRSHPVRGQNANQTPRPRFRPNLETLEGRELMAASLTITDVSVWEGNSGTVSAVFTVTLSEPAAQAVTVNYQTADGAARAGHDYLAAAGTLTFAPGETSKTITVAVLGDTQKEDPESFFVNLSAAVNAQIGDGQGLGIIGNDDLDNGLHNSCKQFKWC